MSYSVTFHYREEIQKGVYSEEEKIKTIKVGSYDEDVPLEVVAGKIFAQLARRNILVVDVEIFEFIKNKLNYREASDGIVIKNKKFKFDDGVGVSASESSDESQDTAKQLLEILASNPELADILRGGGRPSPTRESSLVSTPPQAFPPRSLPHEKVVREKVLRSEIFDPPNWLLQEARKRGLKFTVGKQYPILREKVNPNPGAGIDYTTINDMGEKQILAGLHFNPIPVQLTGNFVNDPQSMSGGGSGGGLSWEGVVEDGQIAIRR